MKLLVLGATSNIGYAFLKESSAEFDLYATCRTPQLESLKGLLPHVKMHAMDIFSDALEGFIQDIQPNVIINTIAIAGVDDCERQKDDCFKVNVHFVERIVSLCKKNDIQLVHFSSNAIYDGLKGNYSEEDIAKPVNYYGECKLKADECVRQNLTNFIILRPTAMIGHKQDFQRNNPLSFVAHFLKAGKPLKLVQEDIVNFVWVEDLAHIMKLLILQKRSGEYNIGGEKALNRYEFGLMVQAVLRLEGEIRPCEYADLNLPAKRGFNTSLDNTKIKKTLNYEFKPLEEIINKEGNA